VGVVGVAAGLIVGLLVGKKVGALAKNDNIIKQQL